jgi:hypothetical protein
MTDVVRASVPAIEEAEGFCSASLMINRSTGRAVSSVVYESRDAMAMARRTAEKIRQRATSRADMNMVEVREFELALARLRVPEMA